MSFKENLQQKVAVEELAEKVIASIGAGSSGYKIDKTHMRALLEMAGYEPLERRGLEMYARDFSKEKNRIVLLDNELKVYETDADDVAMRKNPILAEMVKFRNIRKILNDQDVVVSAKSETVRTIRREILEDLDLSFTEADIEAFYHEGAAALAHEETENMIEILDIFGEILGLSAPSGPLSGGMAVYGHKTETPHGETYGPVYIFLFSDNRLLRYDVALSPAESRKSATYRDLVSGKTEPAAEGPAVLDALREKAMALPEKRIPIA